MRLVTLVSFCALLHLSLAGQDTTKPIGPAEAATKINEQVTILMEVKSAKLAKNVCFLNSEENFKDAKNFTVFIGKDALANFKKAKIDDPATHFRGKTIEAKGKVVLFKDRPELQLSGPDEIKIVEKKKE
jgi:DNA/RNA endonuclease YhcR with UshA esterase domain